MGNLLFFTCFHDVLQMLTRPVFLLLPGNNRWIFTVVVVVVAREQMLPSRMLWGVFHSLWRQLFGCLENIVPTLASMMVMTCRHICFLRFSPGKLLRNNTWGHSFFVIVAEATRCIFQVTSLPLLGVSVVKQHTLECSAPTLPLPNVALQAIQ